MVRFRDALSAALSFGALFTLLSGAGCGTDAKAVDECRDIEEARCEAGKACGLVDDVEGCKRFYRDHCLHGMVVESPGQATVDACVGTIQAAGVCAQNGADITLEDCPAPVSSGAQGAVTACDVVLYPERTNECSFLAVSPAPATGGTGGTSPDPDAGDSYARVDSGTDAAGAGSGGQGGSH